MLRQRYWWDTQKKGNSHRKYRSFFVTPENGYNRWGRVVVLKAKVRQAKHRNNMHNILNAGIDRRTVTWFTKGLRLEKQSKTSLKLFINDEADLLRRLRRHNEGCDGHTGKNNAQSNFHTFVLMNMLMGISRKKWQKNTRLLKHKNWLKTKWMAPINYDKLSVFIMHLCTAN